MVSPSRTHPFPLNQREMCKCAAAKSLRLLSRAMLAGRPKSGWPTQVDTRNPPTSDPSVHDPDDRKREQAKATRNTAESAIYLIVLCKSDHACLLVCLRALLIVPLICGAVVGVHDAMVPQATYH